MLTLYTKATCPFCRRVVAVLERLEVPVEYKDIAAHEEYAEELVARGGKRQVPYLVDEARATEMYESEDIVAYLNAHYGPQNQTQKVRVHHSDATCIACEG